MQARDDSNTVLKTDWGFEPCGIDKLAMLRSLDWDEVYSKPVY